MRIAHRLSVSTIAFLVGIGTAPVLAQTAADNTAANAAWNNQGYTQPSGDTLNSGSVDRLVDQDLNQQQRIEQGLKDGQLTTAEGAQLERGEARIDQMQSSDLSNGTLSAQEAAQLRRAENGENNRITQLDSNGVTTPVGSSNNQMTADVQRNINQQQRIDNGLSNGSLTAQEAGSLEGGQAGVDGAESQAGRNDSISTNEQQNIRGDLNTQNTDIRNDRHNNDVAGPGTTGNNYSGHDDHDRMHRVSDDHNDRDGFASNDAGKTNDQDQDHMTNNQDHDHMNQDRNDAHHVSDDRNDPNRFSSNDQDHDRMNRNRDDTHGADMNRDHQSQDKGWGHWSWDHPKDQNGQYPNMIPVNDNDSANVNASASTGASTTPATTGSSTSVTASDGAAAAPAATPAAPAPTVAPAPHVTPHVAVMPKAK